MTTVAVSQVKLGDKLVQDALTPLGSVLFHKGRVITPREIEILQAFLVPTVVIDSVEVAETESKKVPELPEQDAKSALLEQYAQTVQLLKKVFNQATAGLSVPILDIRTQLEALLQHIDEYKLLTFAPPQNVNHEDYLHHKGVMSAMSCYAMAQWLGFPKKDWMQAALAGLLHDIGNAKIDRDILNKPSGLTADEMEEMKRHTVQGYQLLKNVPGLNEGVKLATLQHHERVDGSGYPLGVGADKIHPYAKLAAIADIYNAMTMKRAYRQATSPYLVLEQLQQDAFGKLEPSYVQVFIDKATQFHNGAVVKLSDGRVGEIVFSDRNHPIRPWVSVQGVIVNLATDRSLYIEETIVMSKTLN